MQARPTLRPGVAALLVAGLATAAPALAQTSNPAAAPTAATAGASQDQTTATDDAADDAAGLPTAPTVTTTPTVPVAATLPTALPTDAAATPAAPQPGQLPPAAQPAATDPNADADLARRATFTIGQQIAVEDGDVIGITPLDLMLQTGSRAEQLQFAASLPLRMGDPDEDDFVSRGDANARFFYRRGGKNSSIETELTYRQNDLDEDILFNPDTNSLVTVDGGSVSNRSARVGYVFGTQAKLGGEIGLLYARRDYSGTTDASLHDSETREGDIRLYLEPTATIRARILATERQVDQDEDGTDSRTRRHGVGASMQVDKVTNLDIELARTDIRREESDGTIEEVTGPSWDISLTRARPLGDLSLSFSSDPGTDGRRENLTFGRSLDLPDYKLSLSVGATHFRGNYDPIFQIGYDRRFSAVSSFQTSLRRAGITSDDGDEAISTSVQASYNRQLGALSSLGASLNYRETEVQTGDDQDGQSFSLSVSYSRSLASELSLVAGASVIRSKQQNGERDEDERVWLGLSRSFDWLP